MIKSKINSALMAIVLLVVAGASVFYGGNVIFTDKEKKHTVEVTVKFNKAPSHVKRNVAVQLDIIGLPSDRRDERPKRTPWTFRASYDKVTSVSVRVTTISRGWQSCDIRLDGHRLGYLPKSSENTGVLVCEWKGLLN